MLAKQNKHNLNCIVRAHLCRLRRALNLNIISSLLMLGAHHRQQYPPDKVYDNHLSNIVQPNSTFIKQPFTKRLKASFYLVYYSVYRQFMHKVIID